MRMSVHQRVDPLGQPRQRGAAWAVQRELAPVKQGVVCCAKRPLMSRL